MAKYELKTKVNDASVKAFIDAVTDEDKRAFCHVLIDLMHKATGAEPKMWGKAIVGFGTYTYTYASGQSGDWMRIGFSPRKANVSIYLMPGFEAAQAKLERLGKYKTGKSCLYITRQSDIDLAVLRALIKDAVAGMNKRYGTQRKTKAPAEKPRRSPKKKASKKKAPKKKAKKKAAAAKKNSTKARAKKRSKQKAARKR